MTVHTSAPSHATVAITLRMLVVFDAIALLFAGGVHLVGARIPLGVAVFDEPPIIPAGIVEGLAGLIFVVAVYAIVAGRAWAWGSALTAHLFAIAGFVIGLVATSGGTTPFNYDYHRVMLGVFLVGLVLLLLPAGRAARRQGERGA
jgi:hypothetical protein